MPHPKRRLVALVALGGWFLAMVLVAASLLARHLIPLPTPPVAAAGPRLLAVRAPEAVGRWTTFHVLLGSCRCSRLVGEHLATSARPAGMVEHVLLVGPDPVLEAKLGARGYRVRVIDPDELTSRFGIEAAPLLVVVGPDDSTRYVGGYTARKQGAEVRDLAILAAVQRAEAAPPLPLFGCAFSKRLLAAVDPLSLR